MGGSCSDYLVVLIKDGWKWNRQLYLVGSVNYEFKFIAITQALLFVRPILLKGIGGDHREGCDVGTKYSATTERCR